MNYHTNDMVWVDEKASMNVIKLNGNDDINYYVIYNAFNRKHTTIHTSMGFMKGSRNSSKTIKSSHLKLVPKTIDTCD